MKICSSFEKKVCMAAFCWHGLAEKYLLVGKMLFYGLSNCSVKFERGNVFFFRYSTFSHMIFRIYFHQHGELAMTKIMDIA